MYKVSQDVLENSKDLINQLCTLLAAAHGGAKLHPKEVERSIKAANLHVKLLEDNYQV